MTPELVVHLVRQALMTAFWVSAPLLAVGFVAGIVLNIVQVATSLQDSTFSAVPRLAAFMVGFLLLAPWMLRQMLTYLVLLVGNMSLYAR